MPQGKGLHKSPSGDCVVFLDVVESIGVLLLAWISACALSTFHSKIV